MSPNSRMEKPDPLYITQLHYYWQSEITILINVNWLLLLSLQKSTHIYSMLSVNQLFTQIINLLLDCSMPEYYEDIYAHWANKLRLLIICI